MDPIIMFFIIGIFAGLAKVNMRLSPAIYEFITMLLLLAIGLKGGVELAKQPFSELTVGIISVAIMGVFTALIAYPVLKYIGRLNKFDAASTAAHYGSVSVGTFAVAMSYLGAREIFFEPHMAVYVVILEIPAIIVGILLVKGISKETDWKKLGHEVFFDKGIVLMVAGLGVGWIVGYEKVNSSIGPLFFDLFKGILAIFLLEMGLIAASKFKALKGYGIFLVAFGVLMPLFNGAIGATTGTMIGLSVGGTAILATLAASASYIAVPAAMRIAVPEANPTISITASLAITFPFNVTVGIPIYLYYAEYLHKLLA